jgi:hypothetical protein
MTRERAVWAPFWYELDQSLDVGAVVDLDFFHVPPGDVRAEGLPVLFRGGWNDASGLYTVRRRIVALHHPRLGSLQSIRAEGLDYTLTLADGRTLSVDAEERPGEIAGWEEEPLDWRILVELESP